MQLDKISQVDLQQVLRQHFHDAFQLYADSKLIPEASFERTNHVKRCLTGIPFPFLNGVLECSSWKGSWDECITEQMDYFNKVNVPFAWFVDENTNQELESALLRRGFTCPGVFQGVIGMLDKPLPIFPRPEGYTFEQVKGDKALQEFNNLVCEVFNMQSPAKEMYYSIMQADSQNSHPLMFHWMARKEGKPVAAVTTLIKDQMVSFWNGATLPELRRQGLSTTLRCIALENARKKGCRLGSSYLMSEALAFGVCSRLGYTSKWRFNVFVAPSQG